MYKTPFVFTERLGDVVPHGRFHIVLRNSITCVIYHAYIICSPGMPFNSRFLVQLDCFLLIPWYAVTIVIQKTQSE